MKKTFALLLTLAMLLCVLAGCGGSTEESAAPAEASAVEAEAEAPVAEAAPAAEEPAAEAPADAGGASGEASGTPEVQSMMPDEGSHAFTKDFEGYREYVLEALANDVNAPADLRDAQVAEFESMTEAGYADGSYYQSLIGLGVFVSYEEFLNY